MKRLNKLQINSEKLIKNDELITLRGGDYGGGPCTCLCYNIFVNPPIYYGYLLSEDGDCPKDCRDAFGGWLTTGSCNN